MIPFSVHPLDEHDVQRTVMAPAEIAPPDGALVEVSALVDGIAPAEENRDAPSVGERVSEGQILVILTPTAQGGGFAQSRGQVERLQREVERSERLFEAGAIAGKRLEESRHDLEIALGRTGRNRWGDGGRLPTESTGPHLWGRCPAKLPAWGAC